MTLFPVSWPRLYRRWPKMVVHKKMRPHLCKLMVLSDVITFAALVEHFDIDSINVLIFCTGCLMTNLHLIRHRISYKDEYIAYLSVSICYKQSWSELTISMWSTIEFEIEWIKGVRMYHNFTLYHCFGIYKRSLVFEKYTPGPKVVVRKK